MLRVGNDLKPSSHGPSERANVFRLLSIALFGSGDLSLYDEILIIVPLAFLSASSEAGDVETGHPKNRTQESYASVQQISNIQEFEIFLKM